MAAVSRVLLNPSIKMARDSRINKFGSSKKKHSISIFRIINISTIFFILISSIIIPQVHSQSGADSPIEETTRHSLSDDEDDLSLSQPASGDEGSAKMDTSNTQLPKTTVLITTTYTTVEPFQPSRSTPIDDTYVIYDGTPEDDTTLDSPEDEDDEILAQPIDPEDYPTVIADDDETPLTPSDSESNWWDVITKKNFWGEKYFLAALLGGAIVGFLIIGIVIIFICHTVRKRDEGSYIVDKKYNQGHIYKHQTGQNEYFA